VKSVKQVIREAASKSAGGRQENKKNQVDSKKENNRKAGRLNRRKV